MDYNDEEVLGIRRYRNLRVYTENGKKQGSEANTPGVKKEGLRREGGKHDRKLLRTMGCDVIAQKQSEVHKCTQFKVQRCTFQAGMHLWTLLGPSLSGSNLSGKWIKCIRQ